MNFELKIDPEAINAEVARAVARSAIGKELDRVITAEVARLSTTYQNPIEAVVRNHITGAITTVIREKYGAQIDAMVAAKVTEAFTAELFEKMWTTFTNQYR